MEWFVFQLRALKDGGLNYTLDDLLSAMERLPAKSGHSKHATISPEDVIENLQVIVNRRARKAA